MTEAHRYLMPRLNLRGNEMALMPQPLSLHERRALAEQLRREVADKIKEAERIEEGVKADEAEWLAAIEQAVANQNSQVPNAEVRGCPPHEPEKE